MQTCLSLSNEDFKIIFTIMVLSVMVGHFLMTVLDHFFRYLILDPLKKRIERRHPRFAEAYRNR